MRYLILYPIVFLKLLLIFSGNASKVSENCVLEMDGESYQSIQLTNTYYYPNIRLNGPGLCNLRILAVGGQWHCTMSQHEDTAKSLIWLKL